MSENTYDRMKEAGLLKFVTPEMEEKAKRQINFLEASLNLAEEHFKSDGLVTTIKALEAIQQAFILKHAAEGLREIIDRLKEKEEVK